MKTFKKLARLVLIAFFIVAGVGHFIFPNFYLRAIPTYLPAPNTLNYLSGILEIVFASMAIFPTTRSLSLWGLILLLVAVFPANINMALHPEIFPEFSRYGLLIRLPFQILFIVWVVFALSDRTDHIPAISEDHGPLL